MKGSHTERSERDYRDAPATVQKAFEKQARVNQDWRFFFQIRGDRYVIVTIVPHPK